MYLHQQIVDLLLLQTDKKLTTKLHSKFTYRITINNKNILKEWYNLSLNYNTINKLRYQNGYCQNVIKLPWNYITGLQSSIYIMEAACYDCKHLLFKVCLYNGIFPNQNCMDRASYNSDAYIINECINVGIIPTIENIDIISYYPSNTNLFKKFIKLGFIPTIKDMDKAVSYNNTEIFKICLEYIKPTQEIMHETAFRGNTEIFKICLEYIKPNQETMNIAIKFDRSEIMKLCIGLKAITYENNGINIDDCFDYGLTD